MFLDVCAGECDGDKILLYKMEMENRNGKEFTDYIPVNLSSAICHGILAEHRG